MPGGARASEAVEAFEEHAHETDELYLFGARIVGMVHAAMRNDQHADLDAVLTKTGLAQFCRCLYWDLPENGADRRECREQCERSLALLHDVLRACCTDTSGFLSQWPSLLEWGNLLGLVRQNALCVELAAPLAGLLPALGEWCRENLTGHCSASKRHRSGHNDLPATPSSAHAQAEALLKILSGLPEEASDVVQGSALYSQVSCANHSCVPNAVVRFDRGNTDLRLVTLRAIAAGEEITISYIDENDSADLEERRAALRDYGFVCDCAKCTASTAQPRFSPDTRRRSSRAENT